MFGEPNMPGQEGVGLAGRCLVSWLSGCGVRGSGRGPGTSAKPSCAHLDWHSSPSSLLLPRLRAGGLLPSSSLPAGLSHVWESLPLNPCKQDLALLCLTPESPLAALPSLAARLSVVSQHFQVGSTSACPLPYAVYFLELTW